MIRCENCGHTLKDDQKICDVCGKPVRRKKTEDVELEEQLAKSIAKIVENETVDAQVYLKEIQGTLDKNKQGQGRVTDNDVLGVSQRSSERQKVSSQTNTSSQRNQAPRQSSSKQQTSRRDADEKNKKNTAGNSSVKTTQRKNKGGKIAAIVCTVILSVAIIIALAFFTINSVIKKAQDNFAYYNNTGIAYVQSQKYADAIPYLEKALTFEESEGKVNLRFSLYDCYKHVIQYS